VLLRLAYLTVTNTFAILRLLPASDRDKDTEILVLRHQIAALERRLGERKVRFTPPDRALLAALLHHLRPETLRRMRLLVRPDTVLRWHRDLIRGRHAARSKPKRPGRPPTVRSIRALVLRLVRENPAWGYRRVHGQLLVLGVKVAPSTVWEILKDAGIDPAPERPATTWADFLRSQAEALLACDFVETVTLCGARIFVLAVGGRAPLAADPGAGCDRASDCLVGGPSRPEPGHGSSGRRMPGAVLDPEPGREVPRAV
jgi:putative transposase